MKIVFGKHFDHVSYVREQENQDLFNILVTGPLGLLGVLERELGLTGSFSSSIERRIEFRSILQTYAEEVGDTFYSDSFEKDPVGVSREVLRYRDQLVLSGWTSSVSGISERIDTLGALEKLYPLSDGVEDRWIKVYKALTEEKSQLSGIGEIDIRDRVENFHPFFAKLFPAMEKAGVEVTFNIVLDPASGAGGNLDRLARLLEMGSGEISLDNEDTKSFQIITFSDPTEIAEFVSSQIPTLKEGVVVNKDAAIFNNVQNSFGSKVSGSAYSDCHTPVAQLFRLSASLFQNPVNIYQLLAYLQVSDHPLPPGIRAGLLRIISDLNGVGNPDWKEFIDEVLKDEEVGQKEILNFLYLDNNDSGVISADDLMKYYNILASWASQRRILQDPDSPLKSQFSHLKSLCKSFTDALRRNEKSTLLTEEFQSLVDEVYESLEIPNYSAQKGSIPLVAAPGQLMDPAKHLLWMDFFNGDMKPRFYDFLGDLETNALKDKGCILWSSSEQARAMFEDYGYALRKTQSRLTLFIAMKSGDEPVKEHPLMAFFRSAVENIDQFIVDGRSMVASESYEEYGWRTPVILNKNTVILPSKEVGIQIDHGEMISRRKVESASSLENLVQYPFDWVFHYSGQISQSNTFELDEIHTTLGKVAHKVVEDIFTLSGFDLEKAEELMSGFDGILYDAIVGYGAILLLPENRFQREILSTKLKSSIFNLFDILNRNMLSPVAVERKIGKEVDSLEGAFVEGFIDLVLKDQHGFPVIFDLKWTMREKKFQKKLAEGKHIQLALYESVLSAEEEKPVKAVAYYLLSHCLLLLPSRFSFQGDQIRSVDTVISEEEILQKLNNSTSYRFQQFAQGFIEEGEQLETETLDYRKDQEEEGMIPLDEDGNGMKKRNYYSPFKVFKGDLL